MKLKTSLALWQRRRKYRTRKLAQVRKRAHKGGTVTRLEAAHIHKWERLLREAEHMVARRRHQIAANKPLRLRALAEMHKLVGIMEVGGNNVGPGVLKIIRANGGAAGEPWCGDTIAFAYRAAGSKVVQRGWAAVRLLGFLTGMQIVRDPLPGDIVAYSFDHTGLFDHWVDKDAGIFASVEGNTGRSGAVSDSRTGGDGVYVKHRNRSLVARWVRVTR